VQWFGARRVPMALLDLARDTSMIGPYSKALVFAALVVSVVASPAFAQRGGNSELPQQSLLNRYGLERAWWGQAAIDTTRERIVYFGMDEDNVYLQTSSGMITAFNGETGRRLWDLRLGRPDSPSLPVTSNEDLVFAVVGMNLYAVNKWTGRPAWHTPLMRYPSTSATADNHRLYVGFLGGSVEAFNLRKLRELASEGLLPQFKYKASEWRYNTSKEITTPAVSTGRTVMFAASNGSLYTVQADNRELIYQFETDFPVSAPLVHTENSLFLASEDFNLYCIDPRRGGIRWRFPSGFPITKSPRVIGPQIFVTPEGGGLYCLSAETGERIWPWHPRMTDFLAATSSKVFASDSLNNVVMLSRQDGNILGTLPLRNFSMHLPNDRTDRLYLATPKGLVICIREENADFPMYHMHPERRPILPEFATEGEAADRAPNTDTDTDDDGR
jgi:outer membrane protein assembly factor BamB